MGYAASFYVDSFVAIYNRFPEKLKTSERGQKLAANIKNFKQSSIGSFSPDFVSQDINGNTFKLSSFQNNKFVLIDFWASWCAPCRHDFPAIKLLNEKYKSKGLEIISISRDEDIEAWKKAIVDDEIASFTHFSTKENSNSLLSDFFVWAIPVKILINKEGRIVGRWRGGGEANKIQLIEAVEELVNEH